MKQFIQLEGISKKGKERVKQLGSRWWVVKKTSVLSARSTQMLIESEDKPTFLRWVNVPPLSDPDFKVTWEN